MPTQILNDKKKSLVSDDRIFLGEGLFETLRVEQQRPLYPTLHWQRMREAALVLNIPFDISYEIWYEQLQRCIQASKIHVGGIKVILSGGAAPRGLELHADISCLIVEAFSYTPPQTALHLISAPWLRDAKNPIYHLKSVNYLESILARRYAKASEADDALFFNIEEHATETTVANIFVIKQEKLFTPMLENGVLAGITRGRLLNLAENAGIACTESAIDKKTIAYADAVFATNALQGIRAVNVFDGISFRTDHPIISLLQQKLMTDETRWN